MSTTPEPGRTERRLDAESLRVLAHPLRSRLLSALRRDGPATATGLAAALATNSGATSYHLRKLESVGLVSDTGEGEGRRRIWRAATESHGWKASDFAGDEDSETALTWLVRDYSHGLAQRFERWLDVEGEWPVAWRDVAGMSDVFMLATPGQAEAFTVDLERLVERYRRVGEGHPDAQRLALYTVLFPMDLDQGPGQ